MKNRLPVYLLGILSTLFSVIACQKENEVIGIPNNTFGTGVPGFEDGPRDKAQFMAPMGITVDATGNLYVTEQPIGSHGWVRKITPAGEVTTFAGERTYDGLDFFRDGPANTALFLGTFGVVTDKQDTVFVTDATNLRIRSINSGKVYTRLITANMSPRGLGIDHQGNLYFTDIGSSRISKFTRSVNHFAVIVGTSVGRAYQDGPVSYAKFNQPYGLAIDAQDDIYVADEGNDCIRKIIVSSGEVITVAGTNEAGMVDGKAKDARFNGPTGVAVDGQGNLFVADNGNNRIRKITPDGMVSTISGDGSEKRLNGPTGVAVDVQGNIYVTDTKNYRIVKIPK